MLCAIISSAIEDASHGNISAITSASAVGHSLDRSSSVSSGLFTGLPFCDHVRDPSRVFAARTNAGAKTPALRSGNVLRVDTEVPFVEIVD